MRSARGRWHVEMDRTNLGSSMVAKTLMAPVPILARKSDLDIVTGRPPAFRPEYIERLREERDQRMLAKLMGHEV